MSPGLISRPSLSAAGRQRGDAHHHVVSPGLISRPSLSVGVGVEDGGLDWRVSPGLISRPSLSEAPPRRIPRILHVSPGLISRPSLSDLDRRDHAGVQRRVAGVNLPAFVERGGR